MKFTGHSRSVDPQYGTSFMSLFWSLEFGGKSMSFGKFVGPWFQLIVGYIILETTEMAKFRECET
jgi:hypothetical protein